MLRADDEAETILQACVNLYHEPFSKVNKKYRAWYTRVVAVQIRFLPRVHKSEAEYAEFIRRLRKEQNKKGH
jgi:uncharacterized protein YfaT (DUF1175 family)